jgi:hypothetical protein
MELLVFVAWYYIIVNVVYDLIVGPISEEK